MNISFSCDCGSFLAYSAISILLYNLRKPGLGNVNEFLENIKWEELAGKAVEISKKLSEGLKKVFEQLRDSDAYDEIIQAVVDFLNEKENWERLFKSFKNKVIRDVVVEQVWGQTKGKVVNKECDFSHSFFFYKTVLTLLFREVNYV